mmetsp:Transcript_62007/g.202270  ORF Transcript_62007/g.202270 Transcript_62007/m.202270 type:complete len:218 (+) Transcript_62007:234-887(+)
MTKESGAALGKNLAAEEQRLAPSSRMSIAWTWRGASGPTRRPIGVDNREVSRCWRAVASTWGRLIRRRRKRPWLPPRRPRRRRRRRLRNSIAWTWRGASGPTRRPHGAENREVSRCCRTVASTRGRLSRRRRRRPWLPPRRPRRRRRRRLRISIAWIWRGASGPTRRPHGAENREVSRCCRTVASTRGRLSRRRLIRPRRPPRRLRRRRHRRRRRRR